jgi:hypothetical protein
MGAEREDRFYRFDPADGSGIFLGLGALQCALLGGGLLGGVAALTAGLPLAAAALPVVAAAVASFARVGGHPVWEWLPLGAGWLIAIATGRRRWFPRIPLLWTDTDPAPAAMPPCLEGLGIVEVPWRGRLSIGAVHDTQAHTLTAGLRVSGPQFVVEPRADQERLLAGWGDVLNQFAVEGGAVTHLSWSDLASPSGLDEHRAWLPEPDPDDLESRGGLRAAYEELLADASATAASHETLITITASGDRLGRAHRTRGEDPLAVLSRALVSTTEALLRGLQNAALTVGDPLTGPDWQRALRHRIDPVTARPQPTRTGRLVERLGLVTAATAGPAALEVAWRHVHVDAAFHRTYHVATWPRLAVPPAWLEPFLSSGGITRTMTVVLTPVPAHQSRRQIERDLVKLESDADTKTQQGRRVDARHRRATQSLLDREEELVAGYAEIGYAGLVTVTASSLDELEDHAEIIEQLAREAGMELRCLDGRQDVGWAAALPLGLAPRTLLT